MAGPNESHESVVIGDGVVVKGTFSVPAKAVINGVIEGDVTAQEVLVGPTGRVTGRVSAQIIDVRGVLNNTTVSEQSLIIRATGKVSGKVQYKEIEIEKGGQIEGALNQGAGAASAAPVTSGSPMGRSTSPNPTANTEGPDTGPDA
jgi:cytoskeletal protein CcmA (bactofilin family)